MTVSAVLFSFAHGAAAQVPPANVQSVISQFKGQLYFAAKNLKTGAVINFRADEKVQTASVIKVPILIDLYCQRVERRLAFSDVIAYTEDIRVEGSGILKHLGPGLRLTLRDAAVLMITQSDNTATNMLIDRLGIESVNARLRRIGLKETTLFKKVFKPAPASAPAAQKKWGLGVTMPAEMMTLLEKIYRKEVADAAGCDDMIAILKGQADRDQIPRYLTGPAWAKVQVAHKTGALDQVRNDVGIVYAAEEDFILSLFAQESPDRKWTADNEATLAVGRLALALLTDLKGRGR
jgi:beta-lactamase class A